MYKCVIGITANMEVSKITLNKSYLKAIIKMGAYPLVIGYEGDILNSLNMIDGLVLSGGGDFGEEALNEVVDTRARDIYPLRDRLELELIKEAFNRGMPLLGICRGAQAMNIAFGGSLNQHVEGHVQTRPRDIVGHSVSLEKDSTLFDIAKGKDILVNSFHHQIIDRVADGFRAVATSEDGYTEAIEYTGNKFMMGVQWHPECLKDIVSTGIFERFIASSIDFSTQK